MIHGRSSFGPCTDELMGVIFTGWLTMANRRAMREVFVRRGKGAAAIWDCETGAIRPVASRVEADGSHVRLSLKPCEAYWLVFDPMSQAGADKAPVTEQKQRSTPISGPWHVCVDMSATENAPATPPPAAFTNPPGVSKPLAPWTELGLPPNFSGYVDYTIEFSLDRIGGKVTLELGRVNWMAEVWVNGKPVGSRLWGPYEFDITSVAKAGNNTLKVRVGNLLLNAIHNLPSPNSTFRHTYFDELDWGEKIKAQNLDPVKWQFRAKTRKRITCDRVCWARCG